MPARLAWPHARRQLVDAQVTNARQIAGGLYPANGKPYETSRPERRAVSQARADRPFLAGVDQEWTSMRPYRFLISLFALATIAGSVVPAFATPSNVGPTADTRFGVAEGFRNPGVMADMNVGWERLILPWDQIQPDKAGDFSHLGQSLPKAQLQIELDRGTTIAGLFQFTPAWAAANPADGKRSVPQNLGLAFDDPNNYFGQYVYQTTKYYSGQINQWIIWNEPEFKPTDPGAGGSFTWLGSDEEFAQLMKVAYLAVKKANPSAVVSFPGTSYWVDTNSNRPLFYDRILSILAQDPNAAANNFYHDVVSLNLYRAPDDVYRVYGVFKTLQKKYGIDKPVWLTETNAMPSDDTSIPCADKHASEAIKTTMDQQAAYGIQALALAAAAGFAKRRWFAAPGDRRAQSGHQQFQWLYQRAVRAVGARQRGVVGLARGPQLAGSQLAGVPGRIRQAWQSTRDRAVEWRRQQLAHPRSEERLERAARRSPGAQPDAAGQPGLVGDRPARGDRVLQSQRSDQGP